MAIIKKQELWKLSDTEIESKLGELAKELMKFERQRAIGTALENPGKMKELRRSVAKLLTVRQFNLYHKNEKEVKEK